MSFKRIEGEIDRAYVDNLLSEGIMTSGIVCITDLAKKSVLSVRRGSRLVGLPIIDLANIEMREKPEHYVSYRLRKMFGLKLKANTLTVLPVKSDVSTYMDIRNQQYPDVHQRVYVPVLGSYDKPVESDSISWADPTDVYHEMAKKDDDCVVDQLKQIHGKLFESFVRVVV